MSFQNYSVLPIIRNLLWLSFYLPSLGNGFNWNVNFVRPVQDWALESVVTFVDLIYSGLARGNGVDQ